MATALTLKQAIAAVWQKFMGVIGYADISGIGDGTVKGAIAGLNGNLTNKIQYREIEVEIGTGLPEGGHSSGAVDVSDEYPSAKKVVAIGGRRGSCAPDSKFQNDGCQSNGT